MPNPLSSDAGKTTTHHNRHGYDHRSIDAKWQARWAASGEFEVPNSPAPGAKEYILDMFPYPSGAGLHVGHPKGYVATDVVSRMKRMQGKMVLHPMGWDAFGLPAENYAIKTGVHPQQTTQSAITRYKEQLNAIGLGYDWTREINTSDPSYYRWTQWLFLQLFKHDLAYQKEAPVNWCATDQTVLANEQVISGNCERCGNAVEQRKLKQWFFRITQYADELLSDLDDLDWPEPIKAMQRNWIGRSSGAEVDFLVKGRSEIITVFTTRIDTLFGGTFLILAPEHPLVATLTTDDQRAAVSRYVTDAAGKTELSRIAVSKDQTGVFTGSYAQNPATNEKMPIWIADFVLAGYGFGAVFADAHDARDFAMAKRYGIPLKATLEPMDDTDAGAVASLTICYTGDGRLVDSAQFSGLTSKKARPTILAWLAARGQARAAIKYKLRDWLVSRQRYWGAPIPIIHCPSCGAVPVPEDQLPVILPTDVDFRPTGESPIARSESFHRSVTCPTCGQPARRESDTMDTFVDSSWYYLRYLSAHDKTQPIDLAVVNQWLPVDLYVGGAEHAVVHLLYARFIMKALADQLKLDVREPFQRLINVGLIRAEDGRKMSKRYGNVINPDDVIDQYGADTLRCYEMFMGPFSDSMPWSTRSVVGVRRWLDRVWTLQTIVDSTTDSSALAMWLNRTIDKVTRDIEAFKFNTAVSALMEFTNAAGREPALPQSVWERFLPILNPFAPHLAAELWSQLHPNQPINTISWPTIDEGSLTSSQLTIAVQVGGRTRATLSVPSSIVEPELVVQALALPGVQRHLTNEPSRTIVVPGRIINFIP